MSTVIQELKTETLKIENLTREQKLQLIEELWVSFCQEETPLPIPDWHLQELDRRLAMPDQNTGSPWPEVRARITGEACDPRDW